MTTNFFSLMQVGREIFITLLRSFAMLVDNTLDLIYDIFRHLNY